MEKQIYPPLWVSTNLVDTDLTEGYPWDFKNNGTFDGVDKNERRRMMLLRTTEWQAYTGIRAANPAQRVSAENPAVAVRAIVVDYDSRTAPEAAEKLINETLPPQLRPNLLEVTLSGKLRLIWFLGREILIMSPAHWQELFECFCKLLKLDNLLAGYDENSAKTSMCWTNGADWYFLSKETPLSIEIVAGLQIQSVKKESLFNHADVPMPEIAAEQAARFPGRWQGDFEVGKTGVRFWDPKADNPAGCQVKPDGMVCFTGPVPFMSWDKIFGKVWCDERRLLKLGKIATNLYYDSRVYFDLVKGEWTERSMGVVERELKCANISDKIGKGQTCSEVDQVMRYIEREKLVTGAAPMVNYPPGVVRVNGQNILNTANLTVIKPVAPPDGDYVKACGLLWHFMEVHQFLGDGMPYFKFWLRRGYENILHYRKRLGHIIFICGPKDCGKTLAMLHICQPAFGGKVADPMKYLMGETNFTDDLVGSAFLTVNDSDFPRTEGLRQKVLLGYKDFAVNPYRISHPKFMKKLSIVSVPRMGVTLNNDAGSTGIMPEISHNTEDKFMFFQAKPAPQGYFPEDDVLEAEFKKALPYYLHYLINVWQPPAEILIKTRMGCKSYYDPHILDMSNSQSYASNLLELLNLWTGVDERFDPEAEGDHSWTGSPTELLSILQMCEETKNIIRDWDQQKITRNLQSLVKMDGSGVSLAGRKSGRYFRIVRSTIKELEENEG
jgi:hypothetical protein